jgi:hypothetical protein
MEFDIYAAAAPNGALLATLTDGRDKQCSISLDGTGAGSFSIPRSSAQATSAIIAQGNLCKVRLTEVSANPIAAFWLDQGRFDLVGTAEAGSEMLTFGGSGARAYLGRAIMWSASYLAGETGPSNGEWPLYNALNGSKAGAILRRLVGEAVSGTRPQQPLPSLSFDFTYTLDSSGATWSATPATSAFIAHVGDYLDAVIASLQSTVPSLVIQMGPDLSLHAYNAFGVDRHSATFAAGKVRLQKGVNIATALTRELGASKIKSHILVSGDPGFYGSASNANTPIREGFAASSGQDVTGLNAIGTGQLALRSANADSIRVGVPYGNTPTTTGLYYPGPVGSSGHYWVGDLITVHTGASGVDYNESTQKIAEIALGETEAGDVIVEVALGSTYSGSDFARIGDVITEQRTDVQQLSNEALRYAHSLITPKVVTSLPALPDPTFPLGSLVFLTTDAKLYRNTDGSTWSKATDGADIVTGTILAGAIAAGAIHAEALAATIILGSLIQTASSGRRVELDADGIRLYDASGGLLVVIPTDGSPVYVNGEIEASSLVVTGNAELHGAANSLAKESATVLQAGVQAPSSAPTLSKGWASHTPTVPTLAGYSLSGISNGYYDTAGGASGATACFVACAVFWNGTAHAYRAIEWKISDWSIDRQTTLTGLPTGAAFGGFPFGFTRLGASWYMANVDPTIGGQNTVRKFNRSDGVQTAAVNRTVAQFAQDIKSDGTNLLVMVTDGTTTKIETWTSAPAFSATKTLTGLPGSATGSSVEYDGTNWWVAIEETSRAYKITISTGAVVANADFPISFVGYAALYWDGTVFHSGSDSLTAPTIKDHTSWDWTTASAIYWVGYAWYDDAGTTHETVIGPRQSITMGRRQQLTVGNATIPTGGADDPDKVRIYMKPNATDPGAGAFKLQVTDALTTRILTTYNSGGAADGAGTAFPGGTGALLQSAGTGWLFRGDGSMALGGASFPASPTTNDSYFRADLDLWFYYDGTRWLSSDLFETGYAGANMAASDPGNSCRGEAPPIPSGCSDIWLVDWLQTIDVVGGTALSGSHNWVGTLVTVRDGSATQDTVTTATISSGALSVYRKLATVSIGALMDSGTAHGMYFVNWVKTGTPGNLYDYGTITYRIVAT